MDTFLNHRIEIPSGASGEVRTTCPECSPTRRKQKEKCLAVNTDKGTWLCHHCGWAGGLSCGEARKTYVRPMYKPQTNLPAHILEWFKTRGIPADILAANRIGYGQSWHDSKGIQFPYFKDGLIVNIKHRSLEKNFRQETGAEKCLYRFDEIAKCDGDTLIITEGEIDALSVQTAGYEMVTSIPDGAPSEGTKNYNTKFDFLKSAEVIFRQYKRIILMTDDDAPGKVAERELARRIGAERCFRVAYPEGCKDANDVLVKQGRGALCRLIENVSPYPVEGLFSPCDLREEVFRLYDCGENRGISTGWASLDSFYTVKPGEVTVVTGIPGNGKSSWVDALIVNLLELHGWSFAVFSPENWPVERHLQGIMEKIGKRPFAKDGRFTPRMEREVIDGLLDHIDDYFQFIVPAEDLLTVETILEKARVAIFRNGIKGVVIDPWNELDHVFEGKTEAQYLSEKLTKIRRFARMNAVHVWIVAHPKVLIKDKHTGMYLPPTMYEISGGAHWRNKADNGICIHRPDFTVDETEIYIQKIRFREVGKLGKVRLRYCCDTGTYIDDLAKS